MEELKLVERKPMNSKEFEEYLKKLRCLGDGLYLYTFAAVSKFRSVKRAYRRGHVSSEGTIYPKRPFNNRKPTIGRHNNELKKQIYGILKAKRTRV